MTSLPEGFGKGESAVFRTPTPTCTQPLDAVNYPEMHSRADGQALWGPRCPVHFGHPERPVPDGPPAGEAWEKWAEARELFATTEDDEARPFFLQAMLSQVTEANPPIKPPLVIEQPKPIQDMQITEALEALWNWLVNLLRPPKLRMAISFSIWFAYMIWVLMSIHN